MAKEGYLIYHEENRPSEIVYATLGEGKLQFYSRRDHGVLVKEVMLSKSKLKIRGVPDDEARNCPYSFTVRLQRCKIRDGRQVVFGKAELLVLSAPSWNERKSWGNSIHSWQRNYWGEPQHRACNMGEEETEAFFDSQYKALLLSLDSAQSPPAMPAQTSPGRAFFTRMTPSALKNVGNRMGTVRTNVSNVTKRLRSKSITFSLPPVGLSVSSSLQQHQPAQQAH